MKSNFKKADYVKMEKSVIDKIFVKENIPEMKDFNQIVNVDIPEMLKEIEKHYEEQKIKFPSNEFIIAETIKNGVNDLHNKFVYLVALQFKLEELIDNKSKNKNK